MQLNKHFHSFLNIFFHRRVFIFILTGALIMLLTFFTENNAVEIAISGLASIFIGIGVNNLSAIETHLKDEQKIKSRLGHAVKMMEIIKSKISRLNGQLNEKNDPAIREELSELEQLAELSVKLIKEGTPPG
jgi:hypothetical protein